MVAKLGILLALLSSDGHWFGGSTASVEFQWAILRGAPEARIDWDLSAGRVVVAKGQVDLHGNKVAGEDNAKTAEGAAASIPVPEVRVTTEMTFRYRAIDPRSKRDIEEGQTAVHVYPRTLLDSAGLRLRGRDIYVWDRPDDLPAVLKEAKILHTSFDDPLKLQFVRPDVLLVGAGQIAGHPEGQAKFYNLASAGTGVLVLRQTNMNRLAGYALLPRKMPEKLATLDDHPLLQHLGRWKISSSEPGWALALPADDSVLPIAWWPRDYPAQPTVAIDALLACKPLGRGRIVFCQYALGPWRSDPRSQLFLDDALDYLMSPVASIPPLAANR